MGLNQQLKEAAEVRSPDGSPAEGHDRGAELVLHQQGDGERRPVPPGPRDPGDPGRDQRAQCGAGSPAHDSMGERYLRETLVDVQLTPLTTGVVSKLTFDVLTCYSDLLFIH